MRDSFSKNKLLIKNTSFLYLRLICVLVLSLITTRIVLKSLGVVDYGIYNVVAGFVSMFAFLNKCLTGATNRYYNYAIGKEDSASVTRVYNSSLRIQFILIILLIFFLEFFGVWYINNKMVIPEERLHAALVVFHCSVLSLGIVIIQTPFSAAVMAYERMHFFAIVSIIDAILKLFIAIFVSFVSYDKLFIFGALMASVSLLNFMLFFVYAKRSFKQLTFSRDKDNELFKSMLSFSGWSMLDPFTYMVRDQGSNLILNLFFGPIVNAAFGVSRQVSAAIHSFASNLSLAFRPQVIQSYSNSDFLRTKRLMVAMSKINFTLQYIMVVPIMFEMDFVLSLWLGPDYPDFSVVFTCIVMIINTINTLNEPISVLMQATGKIKKICSVTAIIVCSVVPLGYFCFKCGMPPYAIYLVMLLLTLINQCVCVWIMSKTVSFFPVNEYLRIIIVPCFRFICLSLAIPVIIFFSLSPSILRFVLLFIVTFVSSTAMAYFIFLDKSERNYGKMIMQKAHLRFIRK